MSQSESFRIPIAIIAIVGFIVGLVVSFWIGGMFGIAPPLLWASLVFFFVMGVYFLDRPKQFLVVMFLYYGLFGGGIFLGFRKVSIPFVSIIDEAILAVPLAIIVMKAINRQLPKHATVFPLIYIALALLSWRVNHAPTVNVVRVTLTYGKFYIFWFFARALGPWSEREKRRWLIGLVLFALIQVAFNFYWQRGPILLFHPDRSIGTVGSAHYVGYFSTIVLFLMAGWSTVAMARRPSPTRRILFVTLAALLIAYNLIFLTDTKHLLVFVPFAALPFFLYPKFSVRLRIGFGTALLLFGVASWAYFSSVGVSRIRARDIWYSIKYSGKGDMVNVLIHRIPKEVPMFFLGAGPGNFCSSVGLLAFRPLSNKYVLPHVVQAHRSGGTATEASALGRPQSSLFTLWGEFGPISGLVYLWFWIHVMLTLWRENLKAPPGDFDAGQRLGIISGMIIVLLVGLLIESFYIGLLMLPLWSLAGMYWPSPSVVTKAAESDPTDEARSPRRRIISF